MPQILNKSNRTYIQYLIMSNKQSKDQQHIYQISGKYEVEKSQNSDSQSASQSASPPKDNPMTQQNQEKQFEFQRQEQEGINEEIQELNHGENEAEHNIEDLTKPDQYFSEYHLKKEHDFQREKVLRELLSERELNRNQQVIIQQKNQIISALQEERRLFENEHKLKNDSLQEEKIKFEAIKQQLAKQNAKMEKEKQERRQELQWQKSNRNTLNIIVTEYGQAIQNALKKYSESFDKDEKERILSQLKQHSSTSIDQNNLKVDQVNYYLTQRLETFNNIIIKKHLEEQNFYKFRIRAIQEQHKKNLKQESDIHLAKINRLELQLQEKQHEIKEKVIEKQRLNKKIEDSQFAVTQIEESSRQQNLQNTDKITNLQRLLEKEKIDSVLKLEKIGSQTEQKYLTFAKKAQQDIKQLQDILSVTQAGFQADIKKLQQQQLDKVKIINKLTSDLQAKVEHTETLEANVRSLKLELQKWQAFKRQNQKNHADYRKLQANLKQDFTKEIQKMEKLHNKIKDENESKLDDVKYKLQKQLKAKQQFFKGQIKELNNQISQWRNKEQNYLYDIQNIKSSNLEKQKQRDAYKVQFQVKTVEVIQNIVKDESAQSQNNRQIFLQATKDLRDKLAQQCNDKQILYRNYCRLDEKYNELSKEHFLQSLKLQETTQSLLQVQLKEQICMKEITQLRDVLSKIQEMHRDVVQEMQHNFDIKLSTTIEETSQFYQVVLNSKEKIYEDDLQKLQQELQSLRLIKKIKEKISADNQIKLENQRQELKMTIKAMQRDHDSAIKANKNEITTLTESNQFLKKSLDLSSEYLSAKQRVLQSLRNQKALFRKTINFIHNELDEKSLEQVLEELDRSKDAYNQEIIDMVNGIFFSVSGVNIQNKRLEQEILQITQEKETLGNILKQIKTNVEDKDKKLEKVEKTATQMSKFQEKIKSLEAELNSARNKSEEHLKGLNRAQEIAKKSGQDLQSIRNSERQTRKDKERLQAKLEQAIKAKKDIQKMLSDKETQRKTQIRELNTKIDILNRERTNSNKETENFMNKQIEQVKTKLQAQKTKHITKLEIQIQKLKDDNQRLLDQKSKFEVTIEDLKKEKQILEVKNKQKTLEQEPIRRLVQSPNSRDSQKLIQYERKANQLETLNKRLERQLQQLKDQLKSAKTDLAQSKKQINKLLDEINQLKRDIDDVPKPQDRRNSWNEQEDNLRGYQQMIDTLREDKDILEKENEILKERLKKIQANNQRSIKSYVSPSKTNGLSDNKSPQKMSQIMQEGSEKKMDELKKNILFGTNCIMGNDHQGSSFIANKIEEIFGNKKKIESTQMLFKYSQTIKVYPFSNFIPKDLMLTQCFFIIFTTKSTKFAILSYKIQMNSRQSAAIFSITNKKVINKRGADSGMFQAVVVENGGDFVVGGGHIRMRPSSKVLAIKDGYKYFEAYDKKEVYGSEYWRQQVSVEVNEIEIHRVYLK